MHYRHLLFQQSLCGKMVQRLVRTCKSSLVSWLRLVKVCCTWLLRTICKALAKCKSGGNFRHLPRFLFCRSLLFVFVSMFLVCSPLASTHRSRSVWPFLSSFRRISWFLGPGFCCCHLLYLFWDYQWQLATSSCVKSGFHFSLLRYCFSSRCSFLFPDFESLAVLLQADFRHMACWKNHRKHLQFLFLMWLCRLSGWAFFSFQISQTKNFWCLWIPPESAVSLLDVLFLSCLCTFQSSCSILSDWDVCLLAQCFASPQTSLLILSSPFLVSSFLFSCDLDITSVLSAFPLDAAAAFVSSPRLHVAVASATSLLSACPAAVAFVSSFEWCVASAPTTSIQDRVFTAAAEFASSFQWGDAATSASTTLSACWFFLSSSAWHS